METAHLRYFLGHSDIVAILGQAFPVLFIHLRHPQFPKNKGRRVTGCIYDIFYIGEPILFSTLFSVSIGFLQKEEDRNVNFFVSSWTLTL